jgi:hypothetical protein
MMQPGMTTRNKRSSYFLAAGLVFIAAGAALGSGHCFMVGFTFIALVVRYRNNAAPWEYLCFVALLTALLVWGLCGSSCPSSSPLLGAIPLMLSYVLDYFDERRQKRGVAADATVTVVASHVGRLAEPSAPPNTGPAKRLEKSGVIERPPSVS